MAPTDIDVEWQTSVIINYLFEDEQTRLLVDEYEHDGPGDQEDSFDPVAIAKKLRAIGDSLNEDSRFIAALADLKQAAAEEAAEVAFSHGVEAACQAYALKDAEVAPEVQIIRASVAFGLYVKKSCPELKMKVQSAMNAFLFRRVGSWITQQGGWEKVPGVAK